MVVADSGPLMALGKLGLLDVLGRLYGEVAIPEAVYREVVMRGSEQGRLDSLQVELSLRRGNLFVAKIEKPVAEVENLPLHEGEKEVLTLALEKKARLVLMDDMLARNRAKSFGFKVKGTLGVIVDAYRREFLSYEEVRIVFEAIGGRSDIWIADALCRRVLESLKPVGHSQTVANGE